MNESIWQMIAETPWWKYVFAAYLVSIAYQAAKPHIITLRSLQYGVVSLVALSLICITKFIHINADTLSHWLVMFLLGGGLGWLQFSRYRLQAIAGEKKLLIPGSRFLFFIIPAAVFLKYYFDVPLSFDVSTLPSANLTILLMSLFGFSTGLFLGRLSYAAHVVKSGPFLAAATN